MPSPDSRHSPDDVALIRAVVQSTMAEAERGVRTSRTLQGVIEDVDEDLDLVYVSMPFETMGSDPTQSDNYETPGIIAATRDGEAFTGEQVRVVFEAMAGATATRTSIENLIIVPYGAEEGDPRIEIDASDPEKAVFRFYDGTGLVGAITPDRWYVGTDGAALTQLDPQGGLRLRSADNILVVDVSSQPYLSINDRHTGQARVIARPEGIRLIDPAQENDLELTTGGIVTPTPRFASTTELNPGTTMNTPAAAQFTADDLELRHVVAWNAVSDLTSVFTVPPGYTGQFEANVATTGAMTLGVVAASRQPAVPNVIRTFTNTQGGFQHAIGSTVVVRGGAPGVSPSIRSSSTDSDEVTADVATLSLAKPAGVVAGDLLVAFVAMGNAGGTVPTGWETPEGWTFLGADFSISGTGAGQSTAATGVWYKPATASEPTDYEVTINFGPGTKVVHSAVFAIQNPGFFSTGAGLLVNDKLMPRLIRAIEHTGAAVQEITFTDVPLDFDNLMVEMALKSAGSDPGGTNREVHLRFNGDTGANYSHRAFGSLGTSGNLSTNGMRIGTLWTGVQRRSNITAKILDASRGTENITVQSQESYRTSTNIETTVYAGWWNNMGPITSITVRTPSQLQFAAGSKFWLYGY